MLLWSDSIAEGEPRKKSFRDGRKNLTGNQAGLKALLVGAGLAWLPSKDPSTQETSDYKGVWPSAVIREVAKRCAVANEEHDGGHVTDEVLKRYIQSVNNWKSNNPACKQMIKKQRNQLNKN